MSKDRRIRKRVLLILLFLLLLLLGAFILWKVFGEEQKPKWDDSLSQVEIDQITYEGRQYSYDTNLVNILFLGIDKNDELRGDNIPGEAGQSDCIMLLTLNKKTKKASILQIPRDTMTNIDIYDANGEYSTTVTEQLATQFAYSTGKENSCWATKKTVSELLLDLPIDCYLAMDMAAIDEVNDAFGGVTITIPEDYTRIDPAFKKGTTLKLTGQQAYKYVHYRDYDLDFSNNGRMQRQLDYIPAFINTVRENGTITGKYYEVLEPLVGDYIFTDMQAAEFDALAEYDLETSNMSVLPGEGKKGEKYEEFHPNLEKIQKFLIETFYILKN